MSSYEYRAWQRSPWVNYDYRKYFPNYPELSFSEYMKLVFCYSRGPFASLPREVKPSDVGIHTVHFIMYFANCPYEALEKLDDHYIEQEDFWDDLARVEFLNNEKLNQEFYELLLRHGYPKRKIEFILEAPKENVSRPKDKDWRDYYTDELVNLVRYKERMLFKIFPHYLDSFRG